MPAPDLYPLTASDPPRIGGFWLDARVAAHESGTGFLAHSTTPRADGRSDVILVQLNSGAAEDPAARDRFAGVINDLHIDDVVARGGDGQADGRLGRRFVDESTGAPPAANPREPAPWVALAADGTDGPVRVADGLLREVQLADVAPQGTPSGPDYQLPWIQRIAPGLTRMWPLPWPGRFDRAGWVSILISWLLMLLLAALAVLIAILIFRNEPPQQPPPIIQPTQGGGSGSGSPQSQEPSDGQDSTSPQPSDGGSQSGSPEPSGQDSGSASPSESRSPSPGGESSGPGAPTTRSRL